MAEDTTPADVRATDATPEAPAVKPARKRAPRAKADPTPTPPAPVCDHKPVINDSPLRQASVATAAGVILGASLAGAVIGGVIGGVIATSTHEPPIVVMPTDPMPRPMQPLTPGTEIPDPPIAVDPMPMDPGGMTSTDPGPVVNPDVDPQLRALADDLVASRVPVDGALAGLGAMGLEARVVMIDGVGQPATMDYRPDRFNLEVQDGIVTAVTFG